MFKTGEPEFKKALVIPAKAGIQEIFNEFGQFVALDPGLRRGDGVDGFGWSRITGTCGTGANSRMGEAVEATTGFRYPMSRWQVSPGAMRLDKKRKGTHG